MIIAKGNSFHTFTAISDGMSEVVTLSRKLIGRSVTPNVATHHARRWRRNQSG
jgi:hypothetical protein